METVKTIKRGGGKQLYEMGRFKVPRESLMNKLGTQTGWPDDFVVNAYVHMIVKSAQERGVKVEFLDSLFWQCFTNPENKPRVGRWTKNVRPVGSRRDLADDGVIVEVRPAGHGYDLFPHSRQDGEPLDGGGNQCVGEANRALRQHVCWPQRVRCKGRSKSIEQVDAVLTY